MQARSLESFRRTVATRNGTFSYLDAGEGSVALFIHGIGTNALLWRNVIDQLRHERRCVALDLPLHGCSPAGPDQDFSLLGLASVVEDFCDALRLESIDLVANDTGGAVAQMFATRNADRLRTLTLTNCDTHTNLPPEAFKPTVERAERGELAPTVGQVMADIRVARDTVFGSTYEHVELLDLELARAYLEPVFGTFERARQFERLVCSVRAEDLVAIEPRLRRLTVPTLVVWGTGDAFFEVRWAYWLKETIPGVTEVVELEKARLFLPDERAAEFVPHLRRHWATTHSGGVAPEPSHRAA
jgi:pimeloyl-ACP methyl ester carboxylesterase